MKYDDEPSKTRKRVLESDPTKLKVDDAEEKISICTSYPSENDANVRKYWIYRMRATITF